MQFGRHHAAWPVGIFRLMQQHEIDGLIANALAQFRAELTPEIASAIAQGIRTYSQRPAGERGAVTVDWGVITGTQTGYATVSIDGGGEVPISTMGDLDPSAIGQRALVLNNPPSERIVISAVGPGSGGTPTPEIVVSTTGRPWTYENIIRDSDGLALASFNGGGFAQDYTLLDVDGTRYGLWMGSSLNPFIGRKRLTDLDWSTLDISSLPGNPLKSPNVNDGHNFTTFGIDGETGLIHVAGNMHAQPLNYFRSTKGVNDPTFNWHTDWTTAQAMTGTNENSVTYPMFHRLRDGTLIFFYRNGSSGDGDQYCKRWVSGAWQDLGQITDGQTDGVSAYLLPPVVDRAGNIDMIFNWRTSGSADTNNGWYYAKITGLTAGGTMAAQRSDGTAITLPIRIDGMLGGVSTPDHWPEKVADFPAPYILNDAAPGAFQPCDPAGYPHSSFMSIDTIGAPQHYHVFKDSAGWKCDQITTFGPWVPDANWAGSTPAGDASRMKIVNTPNGKTLALGHWPAEGRRGKLWCYDLTPGQSGYIPNAGVGAIPSRLQPTGTWFTKSVNQPFPIASFPDQGDFHYGFEGVVGGGGVNPGNELHLLVTSSAQRFYHDPGIDPVVGYGNALSNEAVPAGWGTPDMEPPAGMLGYYVVDLTQLDRFRDRDLNTPTMKIVEFSTGGNIPVPRNTGSFTAAGDLLTFQRETIVNAGGAVNNQSIVFQETAAGRAYGNDGSGNQPSILIPNTYAGAMLFAQLEIQMRVGPGGQSGANSGFIAACIVEAVAMQYSPSHAQTPVGNSYNIGTCWNDSTLGTPGGSNVSQSNYSDSTIFTTSWQALRQFLAVPGGFGGYLGRLRLAARTGNNPAGAFGLITSVTLRLGVLE